jgi:hypothetical protein
MRDSVVFTAEEVLDILMLTKRVDAATAGGPISTAT